MKKNNQIFIVVSEFYSELSNLLLTDCKKELIVQGVQEKNISIYRISGVFEIPGTVSQLSKKSSIAAVITLGVVIKGETPHFNFISSACTNSISKLTIENEFPIIFGVLTTNTYKQALKRAHEKGSEIAKTAIVSINTYREIKSNKF